MATGLPDVSDEFMTQFYHYLALFNALALAVVGVVVFYRNRHQAVGPLFSVAMLVMGVWMVGFAQYYRPLPDDLALRWALWTLTLGVIDTPLIFHAMCALLGCMRRMRWWIAASYVTAVASVGLLWSGYIIEGMRQPPFMNHYVQYDRFWYPFLVLHIVGWQWLGAGLLVRGARKEVGYKRAQYSYFAVAWFAVFLTGNSIIVPIEYEISIQPFGLFVMPFVLTFLAYAISKARLADFNVVISRVLLFTVTIMVIALFTLFFVGAMALFAPGFMNEEQIFFSVSMVLVIGTALTISLPQLLPRAERLMQERLVGTRTTYQYTLGGLVKDLSRIPLIDEVLTTVATKVHTEMQLSRVLIVLRDPLSGRYSLSSQSGMSTEESGKELDLGDSSSVVRWQEEHRDTLVLDEVSRQETPSVVDRIRAEMDRMGVRVCVPMMLDDNLMGFFALGEKASRQMFYVTDIRLLENLATEVALALKYRRMEDAIYRKNRLIELGTIAAGVAHEIRNPLASIRTFAQLLPHKMDDPEFTNDFSKLVLNDVDRITKVIESMLAFARPAQVSIATHGAVDLVDEAIVLVQSRLKSKRIELSRQYHDRPEVRVDKNQIMQVLVNLLNNAVDALPNDGKIRVAVGVQQLDMPDDQELRGEFATIEVSDNGPGIPAVVRSRLFDPFFTTKKEGTGLGLSISQKIVRDHGGFISVTSVEGKGTSFQVNLPLNL